MLHNLFEDGNIALQELTDTKLGALANSTQADIFSLSVGISLESCTTQMA